MKKATATYPSEKLAGHTRSDSKQNRFRLRNLRLTVPHDKEFSRVFSVNEVAAALKELKSGKALGFDEIYPDFRFIAGERQGNGWLHTTKGLNQLKTS